MSKIVVTIPKNGSIEDVKTALKAINQKDVIVKVSECSITLDVEALPKSETINPTEIIVVIKATETIHKLQMVKETKDLFKIGLKEAKDFVDVSYNHSKNDEIFSLINFSRKLNDVGISKTPEQILQDFSEFSKNLEYYEVRLVETTVN